MPTSFEHLLGNALVTLQLRRVSRYLRDTHGRTATEAPRRILTEASKIVGTDKKLDLTKRNIVARLK